MAGCCNCKRCALPGSAQPSAQRLWLDCKQLASLDQLMSWAEVVQESPTRGKGKAMHGTRSESWRQESVALRAGAVDVSARQSGRARPSLGGLLAGPQFLLLLILLVEHVLIRTRVQPRRQSRV